MARQEIQFPVPGLITVSTPGACRGVRTAVLDAIVLMSIPVEEVRTFHFDHSANWGRAISIPLEDAIYDNRFAGTGYSQAMARA